MDKKIIEQFIHDARKSNSVDTFTIHKLAFTELISGLIVKCLEVRTAYAEKIKSHPVERENLKKKSHQAEMQYNALKSMEGFMEVMTYKNCIFHFQAISLVAMDRQILILQEEKADLIEKHHIELTELKKNIKNDNESR